MLHATDQNFARISVRLSTSQQAAEQVAACASVPSFRRSAVHSDLRQVWQAVEGFQSYASCPARLLVLTGTVIRAKFGYLVTVYIPNSAERNPRCLPKTGLRAFAGAGCLQAAPHGARAFPGASLSSPSFPHSSPSQRPPRAPGNPTPLSKPHTRAP